MTANNGAAFIIGPSLGVLLYEAWRPLPYLTAAVMCVLVLGYVARRIAKTQDV